MTDPTSGGEPMWYFDRDGQPQGPVPESHLGVMLARGEVRPEALVWTMGMADWLPAMSTARWQASAMAPASGPVRTSVSAPMMAAPGPMMMTPMSPPIQAGPLGQPVSSGSDGFAITSLILGIFSVTLGVCLWFLGVPASIVGLVLGVKSKTPGGVRTAGIVTSAIGAGLSLIMTLFGIIGLLTDT